MTNNITISNLPIPDDVIIYTVSQVASILKLNKNSVYQLIYSGALPCIKLGQIKIRHDALAKFLETAEGYDYTNPNCIRKIA